MIRKLFSFTKSKLIWFETKFKTKLKIKLKTIKSKHSILIKSNYDLKIANSMVDGITKVIAISLWNAVTMLMVVYIKIELN